MSGEEEAAELTIAEDLVVTKYKMGGDIANRECRAAGGRGAEGGGGGTDRRTWHWAARGRGEGGGGGPGTHRWQPPKGRGRPHGSPG